MFHSTNFNTPKVDFKKAILQGQALDKGLYNLSKIPKLNTNQIYSFNNASFNEIAFEILSKIIKDAIPEEVIKEIIHSALNFDIPVQLIDDNNYICYLDRGPTCSFKDFGARTLARIMEYFLEIENTNVIILTATSGDTGGAVAQAFYKMNNIKVVVLYPKNEVSDLQRKQMTTLGENIFAIGIEGKFDDCQRLVKQAFADEKIKFLNLSSANSINFGRLIPQILYYFWSYSRIIEKINEEVIFSVPCGNFGNLMAGLLANKMGLPVKKYIAAVNENDEFLKFLNTGTYQKIQPSKACISNAMNVGHPSNLARIIDLYGGQIDEKGKIIKKPDMKMIRKNITSYSINDNQTKDTIVKFYKNYQKIIEPHGAVGWAALQVFRNQFPEDRDKKAICFETADPAKFPEEIISLINLKPNLPESLNSIQMKKEYPNPLEITNYQDFKNYLQKNF